MDDAKTTVSFTRMSYEKKESLAKWILLSCAILFGTLLMLLFIFFVIEPIIGIPIEEPHQPSFFELFVLLPIVLFIFIIGMIFGTLIGLLLLRPFVSRHEIESMVKRPYIKGVSDISLKLIKVVYGEKSEYLSLFI